MSSLIKRNKRICRFDLTLVFGWREICCHQCFRNSSNLFFNNRSFKTDKDSALHLCSSVVSRSTVTTVSSETVPGVCGGAACLPWPAALLAWIFKDNKQKRQIITCAKHKRGTRRKTAQHTSAETSRLCHFSALQICRPLAEGFRRKRRLLE